jgi:hypothetical protein
MNIFYLHFIPQICAMYHVNKHVIKMILETAQLLCSAIHILYPENELTFMYKLTHKNHPSSVWARDNINNWKWLLSLGFALCKEYTYRYKKIHKSQAVLEQLKENIHLFENKFSQNVFYPPVPAMDEKFLIKNSNNEVVSMLSYRNYYRLGKSHIHSWQFRDIPDFIFNVPTE